METSTTIFAYTYAVVYPLLTAAAFYYAVRITRIAGVFRGWFLMIAFVIVFALEGLSSSFPLVAFFQPANLSEYIQQVGLRSFVTSGAYSLVLAAILFAAMFEMYRTFRALQGGRSPSRGAFGSGGPR